jgi:hypothetical protein
MNILFLDMDGVCNSKQHFLMVEDQKLDDIKTGKEGKLEYMKAYTNPNNMWVLKYILEQVPDLKIVISSSWRNHFDLELFKELFKHYGLDGERIIDKTPKMFSSQRVHEINSWLDDHKDVEKWVAVDDHEIYLLEDPDKQNEILTDPWLGLTMNDAVLIIKKFNPKFKLPVIHI